MNSRSLFYFFVLVVSLLSFFSLAVIADEDFQEKAVEITKEIRVQKNCGDDGADSRTIMADLPNDAPYRYDSYSYEYVLHQGDDSSIDTNYVPQTNQVRIHAQATNGCFRTALFHIGDDVILDVIVHIHLTKNVCGSAAEPPNNDSTVADAVGGYQKTIGGLQCEYNLANGRRQIVVSNFREKIIQKGKDKKGEVQTKIASDRETLAELTQVFDFYRQESKSLNEDLKKVFNEFRTSQSDGAASATVRLKEIALQASEASLDDIPKLDSDLVKVHAAEVSSLSSFLMTMQILNARYENLELVFRAKLQTFSSFILDQKISSIDLTTESLSDLQKMISSIQERRVDFTKQIESLISALELRESSLITATAKLETRQVVESAERTESASRFLNEVNQKIDDAELSAETLGSSKLALFGAVYLRKRQFADLGAICKSALDSGEPDWMKSGCMAAEPELTRVRVYLEKTLPRQIKINLEGLNLESADRLARRKDIEALLESKKTAEAVRAYDDFISEVED